MKAKITFYIGLAVTLLSLTQMIILFEYIRFLGIATGLFFMLWGYSIGWTINRNLTIIVGHIAITIGCLTIAYGIYQIPFLTHAPSIVEVLDLPLFWGIFTTWGGNCMITHGYCNCAIKMHEKNNQGLKQKN
ncbi:MAG TPA: hypothetical protein PK734_03565 [Bacteroidales bacterium]|nr:MAG: hypothetical protein BWY22_02089 [Bacteroidetes bacterium ADurb.Bin217]HPM12551.1 hypothetical protein [Bacteroidales bacterium]